MLPISICSIVHLKTFGYRKYELILFFAMATTVTISTILSSINAKVRCYKVLFYFGNHIMSVIFGVSLYLQFLFVLARFSCSARVACMNSPGDNFGLETKYCSDVLFLCGFLAGVNALPAVFTFYSPNVAY